MARQSRLKKGLDPDFYSYEKSVYVGMLEKIQITCPIHGDFWQTAANHAYKHAKGCPHCAGQGKTTEIFIKEAQAYHGDTYDYSEAVYAGAHTNLTIICPKHGPFQQTPSNHLHKASGGRGCNKCGQELTAEKISHSKSEWLAIFKEKHGDKYDYSLVDWDKYFANRSNAGYSRIKNIKRYIGSSKIQIRCPKHDFTFSQSPTIHASGTGCILCAQEQLGNCIRRDLDNVLTACSEVHEGYYSYELVDRDNYEATHSKILINCPVHGPFEQLAMSHLKGHGCNDCGIEKRADTQRFSAQEVIEKCKKIYGENRFSYDFDLITKQYQTNTSTVTIHCNTHNQDFDIGAAVLFNGKSGCATCRAENIKDLCLIPLEEQIKKAQKIHNNKYDYSLADTAEYQNSDSKIPIICPIHGVFEQRMGCHIHKASGCPICKSSKGEKFITKILTEKSINFETQKKFPDCKNIKQLPFDFFLPKHNILIEFDGEQHFKPMRFLDPVRGEKKLKELQARDKIKTEWAKSSIYTLHRIIYTEDIEERIDEILK